MMRPPLPPTPVMSLALAGVAATHLIAQQLGMAPALHLAVPVALFGLTAAIVTGRGADWSLIELLRVQLPIAVVFEALAHTVAGTLPAPAMIGGLLVAHVVGVLLTHLVGCTCLPTTPVSSSMSIWTVSVRPAPVRSEPSSGSNAVLGGRDPPGSTLPLSSPARS